MPQSPQEDADDHFSPETLARLKKEISSLRETLVFGIDPSGADPFALQHFMLTVSTLETAEHHLKLAGLHQTRALAR